MKTRSDRRSGTKPASRSPRRSTRTDSRSRSSGGRRDTEDSENEKPRRSWRRDSEEGNRRPARREGDDAPRRSSWKRDEESAPRRSSWRRDSEDTPRRSWRRDSEDTPRRSWSRDEEKPRRYSRDGESRGFATRKPGRPLQRKSAPKKVATHKFASELTSSQRAKLKGMAHNLKPVVLVGASGFSRTVLSEIESALKNHELVKIQLPSQTDAAEKKGALDELAPLLPDHAHIVGRIGRTVILYLEKKPVDAKITLKSL